MPPLLHRLSTKITLQLLGVMLVLTAVISFLVVQGFRQTQETAVARAITGLKSQAHTALHELALSHADRLAAEPGTAALAGQLEQLSLMPGGYAFVVDGNGRLLAASSKAPPELWRLDLTQAADPLLTEAVATMQRGDNGLAELELGGQIMLLAYTPLPDFGWSLALAIPLDAIVARAQPVAAAIRADAERTAQRILFTTGILLALAAVGSLFFTRRLISRPMTGLLGGVRAVGAAEPDVTIPVTTKLVPYAYRGPAAPEKVLAARYQVEDESSQEILRSRRPVIIADMQQDSIRQRAAPAARSAFESVLRYIRGWMAVPLLYQETVVGLLIMHHQEVGAFTAVHAEKAMAFANQAAVAVENARLYSQAQRLSALEERQKLARELHDSVSQALYGIALGARTARTLLDQNPDRLHDPLDYVLTLAEGALDEMRALIFELRPESLAEEGLVAALEKQAAALRARKQIEVMTTLTAEPSIPLEAKHALYRIAQEALHNIGKHARASRVVLSLQQPGDDLLLEVRDNGRGFDTTASFPGHLGLKSMQERAEKCGGHTTIDSQPGQGTSICVRFPLAGGSPN